ncbi:MAG: hypothetical protein ACT4P6_17525, partial [Gemmatimonadaceae bacterium]
MLSFLVIAALLQTQPARSNWSAEVPRQAAVAQALTWLERNFPNQVEEWIRIAEMPGKSEHEQERGRYV